MIYRQLEKLHERDRRYEGAVNAEGDVESVLPSLLGYLRPSSSDLEMG